jgi:hypothetical protein
LCELSIEVGCDEHQEISIGLILGYLDIELMIAGDTTIEPNGDLIPNEHRLDPIC